MKKFTLIELLVVISIIGILASLLLPVLGKTRKRSKAIVCLNNMKSLNTAIFLYTDDNDGYVPAAPNTLTSWDDLLIGYDGQNREITNEYSFDVDDYGNSLKIYHCPEHTYARSANAAGRELIKRAYALTSGIDKSQLPGGGGRNNLGLSRGGWWAEHNFGNSEAAQWSMRLSAINDSATSIMMTEVNTDRQDEEGLMAPLGSHPDSVLSSTKVAEDVIYDPTKHVKPFSQNYLFVDGHVSLMYLQSLAGGIAVDMFETSDASGTYFDCQD